MTRRLLIALLLVSAFALILPAQTGPRGPSAEPRPATLRFLFLDETGGEYFAKNPDGGYRRLSSAPYAISSPLVPADFTPVEIYKLLPAQPLPAPAGAPAPEPIYARIAAVKPAAGSASVLVVLSPQPPAAPSAPPSYRVALYDTDPERFPARSVRVVNLGRATLAVRLGDTAPVAVAAGATEVIPARPDARDRVPARIAVQEAAGWRVLSNKIFTLRPGSRVTGVVVYSPSGMRHTLTREELAEFGPPPPGHFWLTFTDAPPAPDASP